MVKVFTFLSCLNKKQLRETCKNWRRRLAGNKTELLYRSYRYIKSIKSEKKDAIVSIDGNIGCPSFTDFLKKTEVEYVEWKTPPSDEDMVRALIAFGDRIEECGASNSINGDNEFSHAENGNFTHSEFARLVLLLRDDEKAKNALYSMSQSLSRPALDAGMTRDSYWKVIAERFNDSSVKVTFDFDGSIDGVDVSKSLICNRSATALKEQFQKARPDFTKALSKWKRSGQNDPEKFRDFLSYNNGTLYASSKRSYILFVVCRLGTPHVADLLVEGATKAIIGGGCEEGVGYSRKNSDEREQDDASDKKRRRRGTNTFTDEVGLMAKSVKDLGSVVNSLLIGACGRSEIDTSKAKYAAALIVQEEEELYGKLENTYEALERAKSRGDAVMLRFATVRHQIAIANYEGLMSRNGAITNRKD